MDNNTLITIIFFVANLLIAGLVGFLSAVFTIGQYKQKVDTINDDVKDIKGEIKEIRDKAVACETSLKEREPLTKRRSPSTLTDNGKKVLEDSGGKKFVDDKFTDLCDTVEKQNPKTAYDIQELSKTAISSVVLSVKDTDEFTTIKNYLFKAGFQIEDIEEVLAIYLRDKILEKKNLPVEDIDKDDPKAKK